MLEHVRGFLQRGGSGARRRVAWGAWLGLWIAGWAGGAGAADGDGLFALTGEEQAFLAAHAEIRIGVMADWPPLDYVDGAGHPTGLGVDLLAEVNRLLGGAIRIVPGSFEDNLKKTEAGELDGLMDVTPHPEREAFLAFTQPYLDIPHVIVGRRGARYFTGAASLAGRTVALERGFGNVKWFEENFPKVRVRLYDSTRDALDAVARAQADAYAGNRAVAMFLVEREMLTTLQVQGRLEKPPVPLAIGVRKDWPVAAALIDRALGSVLRAEGRAIQAKWFEVAGRAGGTLHLEPAEKAWLEAHPRIRVGVPDQRPPLAFVDEAGRPQGIGVDFIGLLNERLDGRLEVVSGSWTNLRAEIAAGRLEALMDVPAPAGGAPELRTTKPYASLPDVVVARSGQVYYDSVESLAKKTVAVEAGLPGTVHLRASHPEIRLVEHPSARAALVAVSEGKADAYVGNRATATWLIARELLSNLQVQGTVRETASASCIGVRPDLPELAAVLGKALALLPQQGVHGVFERWGGAGQGRGGADITWIQLSPEERQWLDAHPVILYGSNPKWAPVEFIDKNGMPQGISHDYLERFGKALGVEFRPVPIPAWRQAQAKLRDGEVDLLTSATKASAKKVELAFSPPYLSLQTAIFTRQNMPYVGDVAELKGLRVVTVPGYAMKEYLLRQEPELRIQEAKDIPTALKIVEAGGADAFVGALLVTSHYIQQGGHTRIKVAGETGFIYQPAFASRADWKILPEILAKLLDGVREEERNAITRKWLTVTYEQRIDYRKLYKYVAGALALLALFLYWNRRMAAEIRRRQAVEASLRKSEEALVAANKELEAFSYSVSHDLRAPLRHVAGFVQLLQGNARGKLDETGARYLEVIAGAAKKMGELIDDLLSFSRTGRAQMHIEPVPLAALVDECRRELEPETRGRNIEWRIGALPEVAGDRTLLRQVMANLLGNAVKYTGKQAAAVIEVSARREGDLHVVTVRDNGAGFDMQYADKLFGVFQRLHAETEFEGTGIGLANVRRIVVRHGGRTWAEGAVGQGAAFHFTLPAGPADADSEGRT